MQRRLILTAIAALLGMAVTAQAAGPGRSQRNKLTQTQEAYVAAVRWSDFEGAERFIDPAYWQAHPLTDLQRERYRQVQVSNYRERSTSVAADGAIERRGDGRDQPQHPGRTHADGHRALALGPGSQALVAGPGAAGPVAGPIGAGRRAAGLCDNRRPLVYP